MSSLSVVIVSGLSGGGKASILRALEDAGYEAVDNPPLTSLEDMIARGDRRLAVGLDARTRGFDAAAVLDTIGRLRSAPGPLIQLVFAKADESTLLRRYTETRRRHPLAPQGVVADGIAAGARDGLGHRAASASISTCHCGSASPATTSRVEAGAWAANSASRAAR